MLGILIRFIGVCMIAFIGWFQVLAANEAETLEICPVNDDFLIRKRYPDGSCIQLLSSAEGLPLSLEITGPKGEYIRDLHYSYNDHNRPKKIVENRPDGSTLERHYDDKGLVRSLRSSDGSVHYHYQYDKQHRVTVVEDLVNKTAVERIYDKMGLLLEELNAEGYPLRFTYDENGSRTSSTLPDGSAIHYGRFSDNLSSISRVTSEGKEAYSYDVLAVNDQGLPTLVQMIGAAGQADMQWTSQGNLLTLNSEAWSETVSHRDKVVGDDTDHTFTYDVLGHRVTCDGSEKPVRDGESDDIYGNPRYDQGYLLDYDALHRLSSVTAPGVTRWVYRYDGFNRRYCKEFYRWNASKKAWDFDGKQSYLYDGDREIACLDSQGVIYQLRVFDESSGYAVAMELEGRSFAPIHDFRGNLRALIDAETGFVEECYRYSAFGEMQSFDGEGVPLEHSIVDTAWGFGSKRLDPETGWLYFGHRYYRPKQGCWLTPDPLGTMEPGSRYLFAQNSPLDCMDPADHYSMLYASSSVGQWVWEALKHLVVSSGQFYADMVTYFDEHMGLQAMMQSVNDNLQGGAFFILTGQNFEETHSGHVGNGEISGKVRLSYTNGILSRAEDCIRAAECISQSHGRVNVHYIYKATQGYSWDILRTGLGKLGIVSYEAKQLVGLWRDLIAEMGGVGAGGIIMHYAHSAGGTDTANALSLLTAAERRMIKIYTFGSPTIISPDESTDVLNFVSVRDGVPIIGMLTNFHDAVFVGSFWGLPFVDHFFIGGTYSDVWEEQGQAFVQTYGSL